MSRVRARRALVALGVGATLLGAGAVFGAPLTGGGYSLNPSAFTGGGGTSAGGGYSVSGAVGQPLVASASGGGYTIGTGIFAVMEAGETTYRITAPGLRANP
jgi:hypothetical protein